jgi:MATE family multidrug resistance protein
MAFSKRAAMIFTDDPDVLRLVETSMLAVALLHIIDAFTAMSHALIRGLGRQKIGGIGAAVSYWAFGLPMSWYLAFPCDWKLNGLWAGISLGLLL